jgi:hypothetical protein
MGSALSLSLSLSLSQIQTKKPQKISSRIRSWQFFKCHFTKAKRWFNSFFYLIYWWCRWWTTHSLDMWLIWMVSTILIYVCPSSSL